MHVIKKKKKDKTLEMDFVVKETLGTGNTTEIKPLLIFPLLFRDDIFSSSPT